MFPSTNYGNGSDPISYSDQQGYNKPFFDDIIPSSKQEEPLLSFVHLPSPFISYEHEFENQVFLQQSLDPFLPQQPLSAVRDNLSQTVVDMMGFNKNDVMEDTGICHKKSHNSASVEQIPRKRSSKRDRHSKINTAQGPRDRRMRLSLKVAREFFDLQDKLGFDKASKTVEWLLTQSRHEIKKLCISLSKMNYSCSTVVTKSACSTSECEAVSGIDETSIEGTTLDGTKAEPSKCTKKERKHMPSRKTAFDALARESREKARARARERAKAKAREKLWSQGINESKQGEEAVTHEMNHTGGWSPLEMGEESGTQSHIINPSMEVPTEGEAPTSFPQNILNAYEGMIQESTMGMSRWSPSMFLNHLHNPGIPQDYQFPDFHSFNR